MSRVFRDEVRVLFNKSTGSKTLRLSATNIPPVHSNSLCRSKASTFATRAGWPVTRRPWLQTSERYQSSTATKGDPPLTEEAEDYGKAPKSPLAIVFTDIVKSTALWEKDSEAMNEAMAIHDDMIRDLADKYDGYEVKQNGDGFMFAFQSAPSALSFCLDIQLQLQTQEWPQALLELGPARPVIKQNSDESKDNIVLWKGLRLRISAHYGEPVCKWNGVTSRMDYLGPAVNRAARFVGVCEGGQIVVSQEFLQEMKNARRDVTGSAGPLFDKADRTGGSNEELDINELHSEDMSKTLKDTRFELRMLGERHFKGVAENQLLYFIIPKSLVGRIDYLPKQHFVQPNKGNLINGG